MSVNLHALSEAAMRQGWAVGAGSISEVQAEARSLGWAEAPIRRGDPAVTTLRPVTRSQARPNSMSAQYGRGAQPLHTDGAHLGNPPDVVVLANEAPSDIPTRLWRPTHQTRVPEEALHGVFLVHSGKESFFCTAYSKGRLRFDPACMTPCDARARVVVDFFREAVNLAVDQAWAEAGMLLVINNRLVLHARSSAVDEPQRALHRVSFHVESVKP